MVLLKSYSMPAASTVSVLTVRHGSVELDISVVIMDVHEPQIRHVMNQIEFIARAP